MRLTDSTTMTVIASAIAAIDRNEGQAHAGDGAGTSVWQLSQRPSGNATAMDKLRGW